MLRREVDSSMRVKMVLVVALVLSNIAWFVVYRATKRSHQDVITLWHDSQKQQVFWMDQVTKLNNEIGMMCVCKK
jgi:hypothetical protein